MSSPRGTKRDAAELAGAGDRVSPSGQRQRLSGGSEDNVQVELEAALAQIDKAEKELEAQLTCPLTQARNRWNTRSELFTI